MRAFFRPYFLRSMARGSRVRKPAFFSAGRSSGCTMISARAMARRSAPACPDGPPPSRWAKMSTRLDPVDGHQRSLDQLLVHLVREVGLEAAAVQVELAGAGHQAHPHHGLLAAADGLDGTVDDDRLARQRTPRRRRGSVTSTTSVGLGGLGDLGRLRPPRSVRSRQSVRSLGHLLDLERNRLLGGVRDARNPRRPSASSGPDGSACCAGSMPTIAFSTTRSACLSSSSPSARARRPPGKPEWR